MTLHAKLLSCSHDGIKLWDVTATGASVKHVNTLKHHGKAVTCVRWNNSNQVIASAGKDGRIFLLSSDGQVLQTLEDAPLKEVLSIAIDNNDKLIAAACGKLVQVYNIKDKKLEHSFQCHAAVVSCVAFNGEGGRIISGGEDGQIWLHCVVTGKTLQCLRAPLTSPVKSIVFSHLKGNFFGAGYEDGNFLYWDAVKTKIQCIHNHHKSAVTAIAFSPLSPALVVTASLDMGLVFYDVDLKNMVKKIVVGTPLRSMSFMEDGCTLAVGSITGSILFVDLTKSESVTDDLSLINSRLEKAHADGITFLQFQNPPPKRKSSSRSTTSPRTTTSSNGSLHSASSMGTPSSAGYSSSYSVPTLESIGQYRPASLTLSKGDANGPTLGSSSRLSGLSSSTGATHAASCTVPDLKSDHFTGGTYSALTKHNTAPMLARMKADVEATKKELEGSSSSSLRATTPRASSAKYPPPSTDAMEVDSAPAGPSSPSVSKRGLVPSQVISPLRSGDSNIAPTSASYPTLASIPSQKYVAPSHLPASSSSNSLSTVGTGTATLHISAAKAATAAQQETMTPRTSTDDHKHNISPSIPSSRGQPSTTSVPQELPTDVASILEDSLHKHYVAIHRDVQGVHVDMIKHFTQLEDLFESKLQQVVTPLTNRISELELEVQLLNRKLQGL